MDEFPVYNENQLYIYESGSSSFIYGPPGMGKSFYVNRVLRNLKMFKPGDDVRRLIVCYRMWQPCYQDLKEYFTSRGQECIFHDCSSVKDLPITELYNEIGTEKPSLAESNNKYQNEGTTGVWLDDLTATFSPNTHGKLYDLINVTARHRRLIIFITAHSITKNMSGSGASLLNLMQCCSIHVFFADNRSVRDIDQYARFYGRDKERRRLLKVAFKIISSLQHACLIITSNKNIDDRLRCRIMFADNSFIFINNL